MADDGLEQVEDEDKIRQKFERHKNTPFWEKTIFPRIAEISRTGWRAGGRG